MFYRLRTVDGGTAAASRATLIQPDGGTRAFSAEQFSLAPVGEWRSPDGQARYPAALRFQLPALAIDLTIRPLLENQELRLAVRYWEGAVSVSGAAEGRALTGSGYLELTGYDR